MQFKILTEFELDDYISLLSQLSQTEEIKERDKAILMYRRETHGIKTMLSYDEKQLIGAITWFVEPKVSHGAKDVLHIEDVVVDKGYRGKGLGKQMIQEVIKTIGDKWCYKVVLECKEELKEFYEKCGFHQSGIQMRFNLGDT